MKIGVTKIIDMNFFYVSLLLFLDRTKAQTVQSHVLFLLTNNSY